MPGNSETVPLWVVAQIDVIKFLVLLDQHWKMSAKHSRSSRFFEPQFHFFLYEWYEDLIGQYFSTRLEYNNFNYLIILLFTSIKKKAASIVVGVVQLKQ